MPIHVFVVPVRVRSVAPAAVTIGTRSSMQHGLAVVVLPPARSLATMEERDVGRELAERFRAGDPDAVRQLYQRYGRSVYGVAYRALGDRSLAEEAVQQTFLQAWRAAATIDATRELAPWLFTITRRVAIDLYRREARRPHEGSDAVDAADGAHAAPSSGIESIAEHWEVRVAVDQLPPDERTVVRLQHFGGLTHQEIAAELNVPVGTVKSRSFRAHKRLAARLGHLQDVDQDVAT